MKIWKVVECNSKELEKTLNALTHSWTVFSVHDDGVTMTVVAYQEKAPKEPKRGK